MTGEAVAHLHVANGDELDASALYAILRLRTEVFIVEQKCAYADVDGRDLLPSTRHIWLTGDGPEPLAYLRLLQPDDGIVRVSRVCVSAVARRQGHALALMRHAVELIGHRESVLAAQIYAAPLYAAAGYIAEGDEYLDDDIPHITMRRPAVLPL